MNVARTLLPLALVAVAAGPAVAAKPKPLVHQGAAGISAEPEAGETWVPAEGGLRFKASFERKTATKVKRVRAVAFDELFIPCSGGPGYSARDVSIGGFKVKRQRFRYVSKLSPYAEIGASGAENYRFVFTGRLLSKGKRAEGTLQVRFTDAAQGACNTHTMVWRSGT